MSLNSEIRLKSNGSSGRRHKRDNDNNINFEEPKPTTITSRSGHKDQFEV